MASSGLDMGMADSLAILVDTGSGVPTPSVIATAAANTTFRGIALPPHP